MKKLLITGASGFLGWNLCQQAVSEWDVYGTYYNHPLVIPRINLISLDLTNLEQLQSIISNLKPDAIIHTAAQSSPNFCQQYPEQTQIINVDVAVNLAQISRYLAIPYVFTSTDLVFDGLNPPYREIDPTSPINHYGVQKAIAEQQILDIYPEATVCRLPLMFGAASPNSESFMQGFLRILRKGEELKLFTDEYRTPASALTVSKGLLLTLEKQIKGILHLGGKESVSRYEFGLIMAEILELPLSLISGCRQQDVTMSAPRSPNVSLDSSLAFSLGYAPLSLREELLLLKSKVEKLTEE